MRASRGNASPINRNGQVIEALFLSLGDLGSSRILGVLIRSLIITLLIFLLLGIAMGWLLVGSDPCGDDRPSLSSDASLIR